MVGKQVLSTYRIIRRQTSAKGTILFRTASVSPEYFDPDARHQEWTYLAFQLALTKRLVFISEPTHKIHDSPRSVSKSDAYRKEIFRQEYKYDYEKQAIADSVSYVQVQKVQEAKLEKSRILQYALIGGVTLLLVFLIYVYSRYRVTQKQKLIISEQNKELATATELAESANSELKIKSEELEKFNNVMLDREMRIIELKKEANKLAKTNKTDIPYPEVEDV